MKSRYIAAVQDKPWWLAGGIPPGSCVAAYQAKGASSQAGSYVNLANPGTYTCVPIVGKEPTWSVTEGWISDSSKQINTGISPDAGWSMIVHINSTSSGTTIGWTAGVAQTITVPYAFYLVARRGSADDHVYGYGTNAGGLAQLATGDRLSGIHTMAMAGGNCFLDGIADGSVTNSGMTTFTSPIYLLTKYDTIGSGGEPTGFIGYMFSAAIYSTTLSAIQISSLHTAMAAL